VAHEHGHMNAGDNLKRTLLRGCRDLMMIPVGKGLDKAWAHNAESAADEYAALGGSKRALDMASALLKIARIAPVNAVPAMPAGSYLIGKDCGDVTSRVRRLLSLSENAAGPATPGRPAFSRTLWLWPAGLALLLVLHLTDQRLLLSTHDAIEHFVWMIQ
jgi:Zn-dependent protease with chaperone function